MKSPFKSWLASVATEFVEGLADGFLILSGGATASAAVGSSPEHAQALLAALSLKSIGITMLLTGAYYVAAFVKKSPPPFGQEAEPVSPSTPAT